MTNENKELLVCPYCGDVPKKYSHLNPITGEFKVRCVNFSCPIYIKSMSVSSWNTRATPTLVPLDEEEVYAEITSKARPPYLDWDTVLTRRICAKFGQPARKEISVEEIINILEKASSSCGEIVDSQHQEIAEAIKQYIDGKDIARSLQ